MEKITTATTIILSSLINFDYVCVVPQSIKKDKFVESEGDNLIYEQLTPG